MQNFSIVETDKGSALLASSNHTATRLDLPIRPEDVKALILAAMKTEDEHPRVEFHGILADRTADGVRVHQVAKNNWFDIPWARAVRELV
jgi:hypothetical protein